MKLVWDWGGSSYLVSFPFYMFIKFLVILILWLWEPVLKPTFFFIKCVLLIIYTRVYIVRFDYGDLTLSSLSHHYQLPTSPFPVFIELGFVTRSLTRAVGVFICLLLFTGSC